MTRDDLIAELRGKIGDKTAPYAWGVDTLTRHLADGQRKLCEDTGFFRDASSFTITIEAAKLVYLLPVDAIIKVLGVYYNGQRVVETQWDTLKTSGSITFSEQFDVGTVFTLQAWRYPLYDLDHKTGGEYDKNPELPRDLHMGIVYWAAHTLFTDPDEEKGSVTEAADMLTQYNRAVREGRLLFKRTHGIEMNANPNPEYVV